MNEHDRRDLGLIVRDAGPLEHLGFSGLREPIRGSLRSPSSNGYQDALAEANDVVPAEHAQVLIPLLIAESPVSQERD